MEHLAKEALYQFDLRINNSNLENAIREYKDKFVPKEMFPKTKDVINLSVNIPFTSFGLTHSIDCVSRNGIRSAVDSLVNTIGNEILERYKEKERRVNYLKAQDILLTFYPIELPCTGGGVRSTMDSIRGKSISLSIWEEYDINNFLKILKLSTSMSLQFMKK